MRERNAGSVAIVCAALVVGACGGDPAPVAPAPVGAPPPPVAVAEEPERNDAAAPAVERASAPTPVAAEPVTTEPLTTEPVTPEAVDPARRAEVARALSTEGGDPVPAPVVGPSELDVERVAAEFDATSAAEARIEKFVREKVIRGWATERTPHYLFVYDEDIDKKRVLDRLVEELEALREQMYAVLFPPIRPLTAITIVRVCGSRQQYMAYGAPGGSAGYWSPYHEEVVVYQDRNDRREVRTVLRSVASQAYLDQALGGARPHMWFVKGHADYFAGCEAKGGTFVRRPFAWRTETAREAKAKWKAGWRPAGTGGAGAKLTLVEWLRWPGTQFAGSNPWEIQGGVNAALAWSFVYFLRSSDDPGHVAILTRYYEKLALLSASAAAAELRDRAGGRGTTTDDVARDEWAGAALTAALEGVDVAALEAAWLAHEPR